MLLAEDHVAVAKSLVFFLNDFDIVGTVRDGQALIDAAHQLQPDVIIADIQMPVMGGLEALRQLRADVRIVLLTAHSDPQLAAEELLIAIDEVLQGRVYVSPALSNTRATISDQPELPLDRLDENRVTSLAALEKRTQISWKKSQPPWCRARSTCSS